MRANLILLGLALLVGMVGQASPAEMGVLAGVVMRGPLSPVQGPGLPPGAGPAPGVRLLVYGPGRQQVAAVLTDEAGKYRLELPPGSYVIEMEPIKGRGFSKDLPATVTITAGQETRLNIRIDTGIR